MVRILNAEEIEFLQDLDDNIQYDYLFEKNMNVLIDDSVEKNGVDDVIDRLETLLEIDRNRPKITH